LFLKWQIKKTGTFRNSKCPPSTAANGIGPFRIAKSSSENEINSRWVGKTQIGKERFRPGSNLKIHKQKENKNHGSLRTRGEKKILKW
jgi:hypothetical protein